MADATKLDEIILQKALASMRGSIWWRLEALLMVMVATGMAINAIVQAPLDHDTKAAMSMAFLCSVAGTYALSKLVRDQQTVDEIKKAVGDGAAQVPLLTASALHLASSSTAW